MPKSTTTTLTVSSKAFLDLRGSFKVGPGDPVQDIRTVRELMGAEVQSCLPPGHKCLGYPEQPAKAD
jgi:hypothetical protein